MAPTTVAPAIVAVLLGTAALVSAVGRWLPRPLVDATAVVALAGALAGGVDLIRVTRDSRVVVDLGGWRPDGHDGVGVSFSVDAVSACLVVLATSLALLAVVYAMRYVECADGAYHVLVLTFTAGMAAFAMTADLFDMFVFFELMSVCAYALTGFRVEGRQPLQAALTFGVLQSLGAYLSLIGIALVYARTAHLNLHAIGTALAGGPHDAFVSVAFVLCISGWLVKSALVPFHFWNADAHAMATAPVCMLFSGVMSVLGLYGVVRVYTDAFSGALGVEDVRRMLLVLGAATAVVGAVMCVEQLHLKRMLAFSTIAHLGLFAVAAAPMTGDAVGAAGVYAFGHAAPKGALFLGAGVLLNRLRSVDEVRLHGRASQLRLTATVWFVSGLALCGLPPFGSYVGKALSEESAVIGHVPWATPLDIVVTALTGGAVLRAGLRVFLGWGAPPPRRDDDAEDDTEPETAGDRELSRTPWPMATAMVVLVGAALATGVVPGLPSYAGRAAHAMLEPLHEAPPPPPHAWSLHALALGLVTVALAVVYAVASARGGTVTRVSHVAARALQRVRRVHTGRTGDYVVWLLVGVVVTAALVGVGG